MTLPSSQGGTAACQTLTWHELWVPRPTRTISICRPMQQATGVPAPSIDVDGGFKAFLVDKGTSLTNIRATIKQVRKLAEGEGIVHQSRPGETFRAGTFLALEDDLDALKEEANAWLPYKKSDGDLCADKSHGYILNHPIGKLIVYKEHLAASNGAGTGAAPARKRAREPVEARASVLPTVHAQLLMPYQAYAFITQGMPLVMAKPL